MTPPPPGLEPKRPPGWASWRDFGPFPAPADPLRHAWRRGRLTVLSSLVLVDFRGEEKWQWLISVSARGKFPSDDEAKRALRDFGMEPAEEDNHEHGAGVRKWYLHCDWKPGDTPVCECKQTDQTIVEPSGYTWQTEHGSDVEAKRVDQQATNRAARLFR